MKRNRASHAEALREWHHKLAELERSEALDDAERRLRMSGPLMAEIRGMNHYYDTDEYRKAGLGGFSPAFVKRVVDEINRNGLLDLPAAQLPAELLESTRMQTIGTVMDEYLVMTRSKFDRGERGGGR